MFWRYQRGKPRSHLATIEAIYYCILEFHALTSTQPHNGRYDNLLFFFKFMFEMIHETYDPASLKAYQPIDC